MTSSYLRGHLKRYLSAPPPVTHYRYIQRRAVSSPRVACLRAPRPAAGLPRHHGWQASASPSRPSRPRHRCVPPGKPAAPVSTDRCSVRLGASIPARRRALQSSASMTMSLVEPTLTNVARHARAFLPFRDTSPLFRYVHIKRQHTPWVGPYHDLFPRWYGLTTYFLIFPLYLHTKNTMPITGTH